MILMNNFSLESCDGKVKNLEDYKGKTLVLYFYPKDSTKGCTIEAMEFSGLKEDFDKLGAVVVGISKDKISSHKKFIEKDNLKVELLSDPERKVAEKFKVLKAGKMCGKDVIKTIRSTFIFNKEGKLVKEFRDVKPEGHAMDVLNYLKENDL